MSVLEALVAKPDKTAIAVLADAMSAGSVAVQSDAIKVRTKRGW